MEIRRVDGGICYAIVCTRDAAMLVCASVYAVTNSNRLGKLWRTNDTKAQTLGFFFLLHHFGLLFRCRCLRTFIRFCYLLTGRVSARCTHLRTLILPFDLHICRVRTPFAIAHLHLPNIKALQAESVTTAKTIAQRHQTVDEWKEIPLFFFFRSLCSLRSLRCRMEVSVHARTHNSLMCVSVRQSHADFIDHVFCGCCPALMRSHSHILFSLTFFAFVSYTNSTKSASPLQIAIATIIILWTWIVYFYCFKTARKIELSLCVVLAELDFSLLFESSAAFSYTSIQTREHHRLPGQRFVCAHKIIESCWNGSSSSNPLVQ